MAMSGANQESSPPDAKDGSKQLSLRSYIVRSQILPYVLLVQFTLAGVLLISHQLPKDYVPQVRVDAPGAAMDQTSFIIPGQCDAWIAESKGFETNENRTRSNVNPEDDPVIGRVLLGSILSRKQMKGRKRETPRYVTVGGDGYGPSFLFDKCLGWSGLCAVDDKKTIERLRAADRSCRVESCTLADCPLFKDLAHEDPGRLNLLTIDTPERENDTLEKVEWSRTVIDVIVLSGRVSTANELVLAQGYDQVSSPETAAIFVRQAYGLTWKPRQ